MLHLIPLIIGYVGGDVPTEFAKNNLSKRGGGFAINPDFPMCLLIEDKGLYTGAAAISRRLFRNGYFSEELLNRMISHLRWNDVFISNGVPPEFALKHRDKSIDFLSTAIAVDGDSWNYPRIPLDLIREEVKTSTSDELCRCIMANSSIFSEEVEKAEEIIEIIRSRKMASDQAISIFVSRNVAAPLEFFLRNPWCIYWGAITANWGKVLRGGDDKK